MKKSLQSLLFLCVLTLFAPSSSVLAGSTCQDLLTQPGQNGYRCHFKKETGEEVSLCLQFRAPGALSGKFDLLAADGTRFGCTCDAKGSAAHPQFNTAKDFLCVSETDGFSAKGSAKEGKITHGRVANQLGTLSTFACELDANCTPCAPSGARRCNSNGTGFETCEAGVWVPAACPPGTECRSFNSSILCDFPAP